MNAETDAPREKLHVVVVVHGIGRPKAYETLQRFLMHLGESPRADEDGKREPRDDGARKRFRSRRGVESSPRRFVAYESLGALDEYFAQGQPWFTSPTAEGYGFAEIHWADLLAGEDDPRALNVLKWAQHTQHVLRAIDNRRVPADQKRDDLPVELFERVVGDSVLTAQIARSLISYARIETDGLVDSVKHFIASYQLFTESRSIRDQIVEECASKLDRLLQHARERSANGTDVQVHIVAHSLGSVIALLAIMHLAQRSRSPRSDALGQIKSLCTLGSPLDLFVTLHRELFDFEALARIDTASTEGIRWVNYVETADPIASSLTNVSKCLEEHGCNLLASPIEHAYSHTMVPGGAHLSYWTDDRLWDSYYAQCVHRYAARVSRLRNRFGSWSSLTISSVSALLCLVAAWCCVAWAENYQFLYPPREVSWLRRVVCLLMNAEPIEQGHFGPQYLMGVAIVWSVVLGQVMAGSIFRAVRRLRFWQVTCLCVFASTCVVFWTRAASSTRQPLASQLFIGGVVLLTAVQIVGDRWLNWTRSASLALVASLVLAVNFAAVFVQHDHVRNIHAAALGGIVLSSVAVLFWWFATLWMRLFAVWMEYVSGRRHIDVLANRFRE